MKKIISVIALIAVLFTGDRLIGKAFQSQVTNSLFRYSRMYRGDAAADILIVGNSRGLNIYQPYMEEQTGKKTFSVCYFSMPCEIAAALTQDYIDKYPSVKTVLVEISVVEMSDDKLLPGFTTYIPYSKRIDSVIKSKAYDVWKYSQVTHLYRFNNEVFQRALYYRSKLDDDWFYEREIGETLINDAENRSVEFRAPDVHIKDLKDSADYCRAKNIDVKFVIGPFFPRYKVKNLELLKQKVQTATGYTVYDYSYAIQDYTAFSDYLHANRKGGKKFVDLMIRDGLVQMDSSVHAQKNQ